MKVKVVKFVVAPVYVVFGNDGLVVNEGQGPAFNFYPGSPFNIENTIAEAERIITEKINEKLGESEQLSLFDATKTPELRPQ